MIQLKIKDKYGLIIEVGNTLKFWRGVMGMYVIANGQPMSVENIVEIESEEDDDTRTS